jgi:hypothetical protein
MSRKLAAAVLAPAIAVLDRLGLARKLILIALVLIAPALYATWQFRSQQSAQIAFSAKERVGVRELVPAGRLLADVASARSPAVRSAAGDRQASANLPAARASVRRSSAAMEAVDARLGEELGTRAAWKRLRASRATAAVAALVEEVQVKTRRAIEAVAAGTQVGEEGTLAVEAAHASFGRIDAAVDAMAERVAQIAAAVDQVAEGSDRVRSDIVTVSQVAERSSASTEQVSASTQQTTAATQEIAASASDLARTADELEALVGTFRLS